MYSNTTSVYPTHFLRGVELVVEATKEFSLSSENWPYPSQYKFGIPLDHYYAEVWCNGMDWQTNYWIIEENNLENPQIKPLIVFENHDESKNFNDHDFSMLIRGVFYYRRDCLFVKHDNLGFYNELVWQYLTRIGDDIRYDVMQMFQFEHASQLPVKFWMNPLYVPPICFKRKLKTVSVPISISNKPTNVIKVFPTS